MLKLFHEFHQNLPGGSGMGQGRTQQILVPIWIKGADLRIIILGDSWALGRVMPITGGNSNLV